MRKIFQTTLNNGFRMSRRALAIPSIQSAKLMKNRNMLLAGSLVFFTHFGYQQVVSLNDYYEVQVKADMNDGEMKEIQVGPLKDDAVLLAKVDGIYYCVSNKCSHYGAPLSTGALFDDKVKCPWHNASFSVKDGVMDEGPMFNGLQTFPVELKGDTLTIKVEKSKLNKARTLNMVTRGDDPNHYVIVGGGPAGQSAAESLRQGGFQGRITIITSEDTLPYDRTPMSKFIFQTNLKGVQIRNEEFYEKYGIEVQKNSFVEQVDSHNQSVILKGGKHIKYDKLLLATGGNPRRPNVAGNDLAGVLTVRTIHDIDNIKAQALKAKNVVIIGASFIGLESASAIKKELKDKVNVTVVANSKVAFEQSLGSKVGQNGINFHLGTDLKVIEGKDEVSRVVLSDGTVLEADLVILGTGIAPNVGFLKDIQVSKANGGIQTDAFLKTNLKNVYAAGDVASFPYFLTGEQTRVEHHNEAVYQGFIAAMNMVGNPTPVSQIPYFWTRHWDKALNYSGVGKGFDEVIIDGDLNELKFVAFYARQGKIIASASMNIANAQQIISEALRLNVMPSAQEMKEKKFTLENIKERVKGKAGSCRCKRSGTCKSNL